MVGGEFVINPLIAFSKRQGQFSEYGAGITGYHRYYTFGAYYSLKAILASLSLNNGDTVLLPSYLCPSILLPFKEMGVKYSFYKIKEGLLPDLEDIELKLNRPVKAVLFIDYFGVSYHTYLLPILELVGSKSISVIQDCVQAWFREPADLFGDYVFNSFRKYSPVEASVIFSKKVIGIKYRDFNPMFIIRKRLAQVIRYLHIKFSLFKPQSFLTGIDYFNHHYHQDGILALPASNRYLLDRINFSLLAKERLKTYNVLKEFVKKPTMSLMPSESDVPLGFSIQTDNRDRKTSILHSNNIHCPVHWKLSEEINKQDFECSWEISEHELTLPVNVHNYNLNMYLTTLKEVF